LLLASGSISAEDSTETKPSKKLITLLTNHSQDKKDLHGQRQSSQKELLSQLNQSKTWNDLGAAYAKKLSAFDPSLKGTTLKNLVRQFQTVSSPTQFAQALQAKMKALSQVYQEKVQALQTCANKLAKATTDQEIQDILNQYYSQTTN
jgi:hypothetical protein